MKYVSEITKKAYDSEKECLAAEKEFKEKQEAAKAKKEKIAAERTARAKEVEEAYKVAVNASNAYREKLNAFIKDYGSYHMTYSNTRDLVNDVFESVFRFF